MGTVRRSKKSWGIRLLARAGGTLSRRRKHVQRPATRHHSRGRAIRHRRAGAGVHVVGTVFNDQPARMIPRGSRRRNRTQRPAAVVHPVTTPPTRQRFHSQSATHHPRTGHPRPHRHDTPAPRTRDAPPEPPTSTPSPPYRPLHPPHPLHRPQPQALRPVDHEVSGDKPDTECRQPHDRRVRAGLAGGGSEAPVITRAILQFEPFRCPIREVCGVRKCKIAGCSGEGSCPVLSGVFCALAHHRRSWSCGAFNAR